MDPAAGFDLLEQWDAPPTFFSGVRTHIVNGIAHLLFYLEWPDSRGQVEYIVVARMIAPVSTVKASLDYAKRELCNAAPAISYLSDGLAAN